jgi:hypothetical protein
MGTSFTVAEVQCVTVPICFNNNSQIRNIRRGYNVNVLKEKPHILPSVSTKVSAGHVTSIFKVKE